MIERMDAKDLKVKVSFDLPFCLYIADDSYEVQMPSYIATASTIRRKQEHIDPRTGIEEATTELKYDRHGRLRYTGVEIMLPGQAIIERETKRRIKEGEVQINRPTIEISVDTNELILEYSNAAFEESIVVVNYFITIYRKVTHAFYIKAVPRDEIFRATINWFNDNEFLGGAEHGSFGKGMTLEPAGLVPEIDRQFRQRLKVYSPPSLHAELAMNARDYLDLGNYRMAVVESRTCIEVLIDQLLLDHFMHKGTAIQDIKKVLRVEKRTVCNTIEEVLGEAKINEKLKRGLKCVLGNSLAEDITLWERWRKAKSNRETAVHKAAKISEADAKEAIDTLSEISDFIIKRTS